VQPPGLYFRAARPLKRADKAQQALDLALATLTQWRFYGGAIVVLTLPPPKKKFL